MKFLTWKQQLGRPECPYMERWVLNLGLFSIRLHHWFSSDDKRAPHDHPWWFITLVLKGSYTDQEYVGDIIVDPKRDETGRLLGSAAPIPRWRDDVLHRGSIRFRSAYHRHIVDVKPPGCWTLMLTGRDWREWGFWTRRKDNDVMRFRKRTKYFAEHGHHQCNQD